ncbi:MAG TPA: sugar ABC transporter substrate-binding protein [Clostridiaceae bacterium]|nr:sugar ABC transporter substrate-binding protein [Clostridiaceae bacterium]
MKKITSLVLALMMTLTVAACGAKDETPETPGETPVETPGEEPGEEPAEGGLTGEITVQVEEGWKPYYDAAVERFVEANPDAAVELIVTGSFDMLDILDSTDPSNEDIADVFSIPADRIYGLNDNEALAPMDAMAIADKVGGFDNYDAGLGGNFNIDGDYLAFPMNIETLIAYANTANAEAAGIDLTKSVEMNDAGLDVLIPMFDAWFGVAVLNSADIDLLAKADDGTLTSDFTAEWADLPAEKQAAVTAVYEYWKKTQDAGVPMWDAEAAWGHMDTEFTTGGSAALRISGPWDAGAFSGQAGDGADLEIMPIGSITVAGQPLKHWKGGWGIAINSRNEGDDEKMALAEAFIAELMNTEHAVEFFKNTGKIMENVPADVYLSSDLTDADKAIIENVLASYADAPARPLFTEWGSVWDTWKNSVLSWSSVKPADAEAAYKEIKAAFDAMMLNY